MGDPACWLANVCLACGRFTEELEEHAECPNCGAAVGAARRPPQGPPRADAA